MTVVNPEELNRLGAAAMAYGNETGPKERPRIEEPPDEQVTLLAGYLPFGATEYVYDAQVRELNGYDEEALARAGQTRLISQLLESGVVAIGGHEVDKEILEDLLIGDRDALLLGIRVATYGKDLEMTVVCPFCQFAQDVVLDLTEDIPVKAFSDQSDRLFEVKLSKGRRALVNLPTGRDQKALLANDGKTVAQLNTALLASCVQQIDGLPVLGGNAVLKLSIPDRRKLISEITKRGFGPQFSDVNLSCMECDEKIDLALGLADLFLL